MKNLKLTPGSIAKVVASIVAGFIALYAFVYVPAQQLSYTQKSFERAEARVHNSCILIAEQATQQAIANPPEGVTEEPSDEQINEFLNTQYVQCIASEGYNPAELAQKFIAPAPTVAAPAI